VHTANDNDSEYKKSMQDYLFRLATHMLQFSATHFVNENNFRERQWAMRGNNFFFVSAVVISVANYKVSNNIERNGRASTEKEREFMACSWHTTLIMSNDCQRQQQQKMMMMRMLIIKESAQTAFFVVIPLFELHFQLLPFARSSHTMNSPFCSASLARLNELSCTVARR
jgi:predicted nucleic acid-binding Zn ribbon protein